MKKLCLLALSIFSFSVLADNNNGFYAGIGGASIKDDQDQLDTLSRIKATELFGGYKYNDALGVELRIGNGKSTGIGEASIDGTGTNGFASGERHITSYAREIGNYRSIYYKPELVNDEAKLYALLGYSQVDTSSVITDAAYQLNTSTGNYDSKATTVTKSKYSVSGYSYGIGIGFVLNEHFNINIEYRNICEDISNKPNLAAVNVDYRF